MARLRDEDRHSAMKIFCALGPGNIVADAMRDGGIVAGVTGYSFSQQLRRLLVAHGITGVLVTSNPNAGRVEQGGLIFQNLPRRGEGATGLGFHLSRIWYGVRLAVYARRIGADLAIIDSGSTHYFMLTLFKLLGIPVAVNFHNVRWPNGFEPRGTLKTLIRKLDSWFFRHIAAGAMGCSPECGVQARSDGATHLQYFGWTSQFAASDPHPVDPFADPASPFRLLFSGRVERSKGVFDLLAMAQALRNVPGRAVSIEVCGDGGALSELRAEVDRLGLGDCVTLRGRLERHELDAAYHNCHALIVPTRGDFCEGMPLVCAEAVLTAKPIITSRLSNALPVIGECILEAVPENIDSYLDAIRTLADDSGTYARLQSACASASVQFTERSLGYAAAVDRLIASIFSAHVPLHTYDGLYDVKSVSNVAA